MLSEIAQLALKRQSIFKRTALTSFTFRGFQQVSQESAAEIKSSLDRGVTPRFVLGGQF